MHCLWCGVDMSLLTSRTGRCTHAVLLLRLLLTISPRLDSSSTAKNILTCLLKVNPADRISANQLLENPWTTVRHWFLPAAGINLIKRVTEGAFMVCFVPQGDPNVPAIPYGVLEMLRYQLEEKDSKTMEMTSKLKWTLIYKKVLKMGSEQFKSTMSLFN